VPRGAYTLPHVLGYHGCDAELGEAVLAGKRQLKPSSNDYDWLGRGIYFWVDSPERAWNWASHHRSGAIHSPFVLGALIYPGLCLNLTDYAVIKQLRAAHKLLAANVPAEEMPTNTLLQHGISMLRRLDCAVIEMLHDLRAERNDEKYDSVYGVFDEGKEAFPGAGFREKTHIQLAVRNPDIILAYFRVNTRTLIRPHARDRRTRCLSPLGRLKSVSYGQ